MRAWGYGYSGVLKYVICRDHKIFMKDTRFCQDCYQMSNQWDYMIVKIFHRFLYGSFEIPLMLWTGENEKGSQGKKTRSYEIYCTNDFSLGIWTGGWGAWHKTDSVNESNLHDFGS